MVGQTVVYIPGVWDLLHAGHLNVLQRAKLAGHHLIVGVCSDRVVEQTKGRTIVSQNERSALLQGLSCVDEVHVYDSLDQRIALELFQVDVFCVGEEFGIYEEHTWALDYCKINNITVRVIKRYPGVSSSELRARVMESDRRVKSPEHVFPALAVDYHDCLTFDPPFFRSLFDVWPGKAYILSGTPERQRKLVCDQLRKLGFLEGGNFELLLLGYDYMPHDVSINHFKRMREHKLAKLKQYNIGVYFDDNPFYVEWMREHGITTFQMVLPSKYIKDFGNKDPHFTCHLQEKQFHFLSCLADSEVKSKTPHHEQ